MDDELKEEIDKQMLELKKMKERLGKKSVPTKKTNKKNDTVLIKKREIYEEEYKPKIKTDPISKYLGEDDQEEYEPEQPRTQSDKMEKQNINKIRQKDKNFIHKRIAAQEVNGWVRKGIIISVMNIVGLLVFYMLLILGTGLAITVVMFGLIIADAYFLMRFRKHQIYLIRRYNVVVQGGFFSTGRIPKIRRYNPRGRRFQERPQDYDDYEEERSRKYEREKMYEDKEEEEW